eukprot:1790315-Prymnesium_polylepis.1
MPSLINTGRVGAPAERGRNAFATNPKAAAAIMMLHIVCLDGAELDEATRTHRWFGANVPPAKRI